MILELILFEWLIGRLRIVENKNKRYIGYGLIILTQLCELFLKSNNSIDDWWYPALAVSVGIVATIILFREKITRKIAVFLFAFGYIDIIEYPVKVLITSNNNFLIYVITIIIIFIVGKMIDKSKKAAILIPYIESRYFVASGIIEIVNTGIIVMTDIEMDDGSERLKLMLNILTAISFVILGIFGILFMFLGASRKQLEVDNEINKKYLLIQRDHYNQLYSHMREIRKIKHDINAHINILYSKIKSKEYSGAVEYMEDIREHYFIDRKLDIYYNNGIIDAIIYDFKQKHPTIEFSCSGDFSGKSDISDFTFCTILSNCISNAVEASEKLKDRKKEIQINISNIKNHVVIIVENPIEWNVDVSQLGNYTSKDDKLTHGYGINNIVSEVEASGGNYRFCADEGKFKVEIVI